jgi:sulfatase maturation enzyme AslB (radical SAM superfamily)
MALYKLAKMMGVEFATATLHNSYYFHKDNNRVDTMPEILNTLQSLAEDLLKSKSPKNWFRSYFNYGLMNYLQGNERLLPCRMAHDAFFLEPNGDVVPCNGMDQPMPFGNLRTQTWDEIWHSTEAERVRKTVRNCPKQCWMMGSVGQEMKKHVMTPAKWVFSHKFLGQPIDIPPKKDLHPHGLFGIDSQTAKQTMPLINIRHARAAAGK